MKKKQLRNSNSTTLELIRKVIENLTIIIEWIIQKYMIFDQWLLWACNRISIILARVNFFSQTKLKMRNWSFPDLVWRSRWERKSDIQFFYDIEKCNSSRNGYFEFKLFQYFSQQNFLHIIWPFFTFDWNSKSLNFLKEVSFVQKNQIVTKEIIK